ncbi:hypothetical protein MLD38_037622 [Melastoma candidum]|uniref:Uncharacterized protein n=1 Tax=Melastoma candidum TaxID=119954 RepID=A0ACB9LNM2_9MYRT|nr:hypothetical protein MLD38_037622 [Melastoma candidum]
MPDLPQDPGILLLVFLPQLLPPLRRMVFLWRDGVAVHVKDGVFSWDDESEEATLKDINFEVKKGQLAAIVGTIGSGKSSLLSSVLGEMHKISRKIRIGGSTAYVAQTSWIQNGIIEENILFGLPMNVGRYKEVIRVCCLEKDLEMMEFRDQTP